MTTPYQITGKGHALLFLHGAYINDKIWEPNLKDFAQSFQVISVQLYSHGTAPTLDVKEYKITDFTQQIFDLLDHLAIAKCSIIGLSLGSMVAQNFASLYPEKVASLVLIGNVASMRLTLLEKSITMVLVPKRLALALFGSLSTKQFLKFAFFLTWFMRGNKWLGNKDTRQNIREMISGMERAEIKKVFAAVYTFREQNLDNGTFPMLLLNGEFDSPVIHYHAKYIERRYPKRATFTIMKGCGHACNHDDPKAFFEITTNWLKDRGISE